MFNEDSWGKVYIFSENIKIVNVLLKNWLNDKQVPRLILPIYILFHRFNWIKILIYLINTCDMQVLFHLPKEIKNILKYIFHNEIILIC